MAAGGGWQWIKSEWCDVAGWGSSLGVGVLLVWCEEVGVREIGRWWKAGQSVNGVEGKACDALDGLW